MTGESQLTRREQIRQLRRVAERALEQFGMEPVSLSLLAHVFNTTFVAVGPDGAKYVLHINRFGTDTVPEEVRRVREESELWWLSLLGEEFGQAVPVPVHAPGGEGVVSVSVDGASPLLCTLFRWVGGRYVRSRLMPAHLEAVGRLTARLHDHSERLTVPAWFDRPTVDAADGETEDFMARILVDGVSPDAAEVLRAVYRRVRQAQEELGDGSDTFGLIHADIHQWNYLFDGGNVRLIDFGDCGWGHHLYDFAVILNCLEGHPRHPALRAALLRGYRQVRDLSPKHEALIDTFVMLREAQDLTWFVRDRHDPQYEKFTAQIGKMLVWLQERFAGKP